MGELSHIDKQNKVRMVDVGGKDATKRTAMAESIVRLSQAHLDTLEAERNPKGNVFETARIAGIMAAKHTSDLIPLCHPLPIDHVQIDIEKTGDHVRIVSEVSTTGRTGVEMEALTAASVSALTLYDMLKAAGQGMVIESTRLLRKAGGKSGEYRTASATEKV